MREDEDRGQGWVVCYDVADDGQRQRVADVLSSYGVREQFSVFSCWLTRRERRRLMRELSRLLADDRDERERGLCVVHVYALSQSQADPAASPTQAQVSHWLA